MATHTSAKFRNLELGDLDVEGVIAFLSTINLDKVLGNEFKDQQIDGELLVDGTY